MTTWAKDNNGVLQYASAAEFKGIPHWEQHEAVCRNKGYLPLEGTPEPQEGYIASPATWHTVQQSDIRREPRQVIVEDFDPETGEKTGEHMEMQDMDITVDKSYIQIDTWDYTPAPVPPPEPEPVIRYSKYKIQLACQKRNLWEAVKEAIANANLTDSWSNIVDIASDNPELQAALPNIKTAFGADTVEVVLAESIAD